MACSVCWPNGKLELKYSRPRPCLHLTGEATTEVHGTVGDLRPGKLDLLFRISHLLDLCACGSSLFIIQMLYTLNKSMVRQPLKVGVSLLVRHLRRQVSDEVGADAI